MKRLLPAEFENPVTPEIIGPKPKVDPLRPIPYMLADRIAMVKHADEYQLTHVVPRFVLPLRPEDIAGLLIHEVDMQGRILRFGTRFDERDRTKSGTSFSVPFPPEILPLINAAIAGRPDGPVFRARRFFDRARRPKTIVTAAGDMDSAVERALIKATPAIVGPRDTKTVVRKAIAQPGASPSTPFAGSSTSFASLRESTVRIPSISSEARC